MRIKRILRLVALIFLIILASIIPFPMVVHHKDKLPQNLIEMVDQQDDENEDDDEKEYIM